MKPIGRRKQTSKSKTDCHPQRGYVNWWEDMIPPNKTFGNKQALDYELDVYDKELKD